MTWEEWVGASYNTAPKKYGLSTYDPQVSMGYMAYRYCEDGYFSYQLLKYITIIMAHIKLIK